MMTKYASDVWATLRFKGMSLDPDVVSEALGLEPTHANRPGEAAKPHWSPSRIGNWSLRCPLESLDLNEHLAWLTDSLSDPPTIPSMLKDGTVEHAYLDCVWTSRDGHGGPLIEPEVMGALHRHGLQLYIDCQFDSDDAAK